LQDDTRQDESAASEQWHQSLATGLFDSIGDANQAYEAHQNKLNKSTPLSE
jgi:hypothetical protein